VLRRYYIREAQPVDLPALHELYLMTGLVKSGPPDTLTGIALQLWRNREVCLPLVACDPDHGHVVAAAEIIRVPTAARHKAMLENVATHPAHHGQGLSSAILGRLFWCAQHVWQAGKIIWVSEALPVREAARRLYHRAGAEIAFGTVSDFVLRLPWEPPPKWQPHFVDWREAPFHTVSMHADMK
jgi:GNAT superfamily N-acetyltransferase